MATDGTDRPAPPQRQVLLPASRLRALLESLPPVDDPFADDLQKIRREIGPPEDPWAS
jgi:hypothetical protein